MARKVKYRTGYKKRELVRIVADSNGSRRERRAAKFNKGEIVDHVIEDDRGKME